MQKNYNIANSFSSKYNKSDEEFSLNDEFCRESKFSNSTFDGGLFRRWLLNIAEIPNRLTNRLKDWLRATPGSRGSTSDKSSGTNSKEKHKIQLTGSREKNDDFSWESCNHSKNYNPSLYDDLRNNSHDTNYHRSLKNHHVYHVYKQNEIGIERVMEGQRDYSTSWLRRDERFSSSPVLVLPRIDPHTGQPIIHPRNYHSRTLTERRLITRRDENRKNDHRRKDIWKLESKCTHQKDSENFIEKDLQKSKTSLKNFEKIIDDKPSKPEDEELTVTTNFSETISLRLRLDCESLEKKGDNCVLDKNNLDNDEIEEQEEKDEERKREEKYEETKRESRELHDFPNISSLTRNNVDELLNNLRERINCLNSTKKSNHSETGNYETDRLLAGQWQDKSGLFANYTKHVCPETRPSFVKRIQDIWIQEKSSSQWSVLHNNKNLISDENVKITHHGNLAEKEEEEIEIEKKTNFYEIDTNVISKSKITKISPIELSTNYEIPKPEICHVGVQHNFIEPTMPEECLFPSPPECIISSENNEEKSAMQISQPLKDSTRYNEIEGDTIQFPAFSLEILPQHTASKEKNDFASPQPVISIESRDTQETIDPSNKLPCRRAFSSNIGAIKSRFALRYQCRKKLRCRLKKITRIRLKSSLRFTNSSFVNSRKVRIIGNRFSKKIHLWLTNKFHSDKRRNNSISSDEGDTWSGIKFGKLTRSLRNIFKCIDKTSEIDFSDVFKKTHSLGEFSTIVIISSRQEEEGKVKSLGSKTNEDIFTNEENLRTISSIRQDESFDFRKIEPAAENDRANTNDRSTTKLSVTTSNSTNIPLQLLGSTSDTRNVPSNNSQVNLTAYPIVDSSCTESKMRKVEQQMKISRIVSSRRGKKNLKLKKITADSKIKDELKNSNISEERKNGEEYLANSERKFMRLNQTSEAKKLPRKLISKDNISIHPRPTEEPEKLEKKIIEKKHSLSIDNMPSRKRIISNSSLLDKKVEKNVRLQRRESLIDTSIDKLSREGIKNFEIRNANITRFKRGESIFDTDGAAKNRKISRIREEAKENRNLIEKRLPSFTMTKSPSGKLRQRMDSPVIPRRIADSYIRRSITGGKSSLIPVCVKYAKPKNEQSREKNILSNVYRKSKMIDNKNPLCPLNSIKKSRPSLKRTPRDSSHLRGKSYHKVHFKINDDTSDEAKLPIKTEDMNENVDTNYSTNLFREMDDKGLVRKITSSLKNGVPLKRITIMDPYSVSNKILALNSKVENEVIDRKRESLVDMKNSTKRMKSKKPIDRVNKEIVNRSIGNEKSLSEKIPKLRGSLEKSNSNEIKLSYRSRAKEENKSERSNNDEQRIIDLTGIKERVDSEILERTSRISGTEDCDCAIILINAINSSIELNDV